MAEKRKSNGQFAKGNVPHNKKDRENPLIECACGCGKKLKKYDDRWRERKYMSGHQSCKHDKQFKKGHEPWNKGKTDRIEMVCENCGKKFKVVKSRKNRAKFCSLSCSAQYNNKHSDNCGFNKGNEPWNKDKKYTDKEKEKMNMDGLKKGWGWLKGIGHTKKSREKMSATRQGTDIDNWDGFKKSKNKLERRRFRYELKNKVFKRDNYTCQVCGKSGGVLHVDHIKPWADYPELRFDLDNCRTVCVPCHYRITFGEEMPDESNWGYYFNGKVGEKWQH